MIIHVTSAPSGAASENRRRWPRAERFETPSFRRMDVRPKAAGALWTRMAMKITMPRLLFESEVEEVEDAPRAMPSARA